jgi:hypothetical protein
MPAPPPKDAKPGDPYCSNCGYLLRGAVAAAECPECGGPLVDVLTRFTPTNIVGFRSVRRRSTATVFGLPVWEIAWGPDPIKGERIGRARALIAMGDQAFGGIAFGGIAVGVVSFGGVSIGIGALGGLAIGAASSGGGCAIGGIAAGGLAVGGMTTGGMAVGIAAQGGMAVGVYARGGGAVGKHVISPRAGTPDPDAVQMFKNLAPIMGASGPTPAFGGLISMRPVGVILGIDIALAALISLIALTFSRRTNPFSSPTASRPR